MVSTLSMQNMVNGREKEDSTVKSSAMHANAGSASGSTDTEELVVRRSFKGASRSLNEPSNSKVARCGRREERMMRPESPSATKPRIGEQVLYAQNSANDTNKHK